MTAAWFCRSCGRTMNYVANRGYVCRPCNPLPLSPIFTPKRTKVTHHVMQ